MPDRAQRWRCFDEVTGIPALEDQEGFGQEACGAGYTALSQQWDTRRTCANKLYHLVPYKQNYLIARYSANPNTHPTSAAFGSAEDQEVDHTELKFQLSLKVKVAEQIGNIADLWFGYTQQSNWQTFNSSNARPFRETNYEPELIVAFPLHGEGRVLGFSPRILNLGLVHQSSGQPDPFSRSWDRVYVQAGLDRDLERGHDQFALIARGWYRLPERSNEDDNPDIQHYLGYGDLLLFWKRGDNNLSALVRNNLQTQNNRGSLQLNWSVPIARPPSVARANSVPTEHALRFYVQLFTGYGETLVDYNQYQTTIGIGIMLTDWM